VERNRGLALYYRYDKLSGSLAGPCYNRQEAASLLLVFKYLYQYWLAGENINFYLKRAQRNAMKNIRSFLFTVIACLGFAIGHAQFIVVNYMQVKPGGEAAYIELERNWKKVHEARQLAGNMMQWFLYTKEFGGAADGYQFMTVNVYKSLADYFSEDWDAINKWLPDMNEKAWADFSVKTESIRTIALTQCFYVNAKTAAKGAKPHQFLVLDLMKTFPSKEGDYAKSEMEIFKPVHEEMVKQKNKEGWEFWQKQFGSNAAFDFATANYYSSMAQFGTGDWEAIFKKVHPGKSIELVNNALRTRDMKETIVWRLVDYLPAVSK
jgi:hypothetical protein